MIRSKAIPERYSKHKLNPLDEYFAMGRGHQKSDGVDVPSLVWLCTSCNFESLSDKPWICRRW